LPYLKIDCKPMIIIVLELCHGRGWSDYSWKTPPVSGNPLGRLVGMSSKCCDEISPHKSARDE
jgi:hypothetical protein